MRTWICPKCLHQGKPRIVKRGSHGLEVAGWLFFPLGVPYSIWRSITKKQVCGACRAENLVDIDSEFGADLYERYLKEVMGIETKTKPKMEAKQKPEPVVELLSNRRNPQISYEDKGEW